MSATNAAALLANVRVASPCRARWGHMIGDDRVRFCAECRKHVYNFAALTAAEAAALIREKEGRLCARLYQRADGKVLTSDCPVGAAQVWTTLRRLATAAGALAFAGVIAWAAATGQDDSRATRPRSRFQQAWSEAVWTVKGWLGLNPPRVVMGDICVLPAPSPPPAPPTQASP
jgi:hypothetical protein